MNVLTLKDIDVKGKYVLLRIDINAPYDEKKKKISDNPRILSHSTTVKYLSSKKAKLVILAHQGRKGDSDFTDMSQHAKLLTKHSGKKVQFVPDIMGENAISKIKSMKPGDIILLDNVRGLEEETAKISIEEHAKSQFVAKIAPLFDYFVQDGFSVCHRAQASVVGFPYLIKAVAGLVLEKELKSLEKINPEQKATYVLGGAKPEEDIVVLRHALENKNNIILTGGVFGLYCIAAKGANLGNNMEKLDAKVLAEMKPLAVVDQVMVPEDLIDERGKTISVYDLPSDNNLLDIGPKTIKKYSGIIKSSKVIFSKGPMGKYEDKKFAKGTQTILKAIASSKAFSLIGGGNTTDAITKFKIPERKFGHVSLAGGALLEYIAGDKLPGVEVLKRWKK